MEDVCTYQILIRGRAAADDLNPRSPLQVTVEPAGADSTRLSFQADQAGLVGLIRHLHGLGIAFISIECLGNDH